MEKKGRLDERVKRIIELYRDGVNADESVKILAAEGWTSFQIFEATILMKKRIDEVTALQRGG